MSAASRMLLAIVILSAALAIRAHAADAVAGDDGRRAVDVPQLGISVRAPLAWMLIQWAQEDRAFVLNLPQERGSPPGSVTCQLEFADGTLDDCRRQQLALESEPKETKPLAKFVRDEIEQLDPQKFQSLAAQKIAERWVRLSESRSPRGRKTFDLTYHMLHGGIMYAFALRTDEEHFDAYRADFDDLCAAARFREPTQGLARLPGGFWLQRDYAFALWLPAGFHPSVAARGKILLSANRPADKKQDAGVAPSGAAELLVVGSAGAPLDLDALRDSLPADIIAADPKARVDRCELVRQGQSRALESVVFTRHDEQPIAIFARRFRGQARNYELRATCPADEFETYVERWRKAADSFREVEAKKADGLL
jgi:hypothetical protein